MEKRICTVKLAHQLESVAPPVQCFHGDVDASKELKIRRRLLTEDLSIQATLAKPVRLSRGRLCFVLTQGARNVAGSVGSMLRWCCQSKPYIYSEGLILHGSYKRVKWRSHTTWCVLTNARQEYCSTRDCAVASRTATSDKTRCEHRYFEEHWDGLFKLALGWRDHHTPTPSERHPFLRRRFHTAYVRLADFPVNL